MPPPAALLAMPGAVVAAKRIAWEASVYLATPEAAHLTSAAFCAILANWLWKKVPQWIREDVSFQSLIRPRSSSSMPVSPNSQNREELSHLNSVLQKFQSLAQSVEKMHNIPHIHACILAYIKWSGQMKQAQLEGRVEETQTRDHFYKSVGRNVAMEELRSPKHQVALEFATWAYQNDTNRLSDILNARNFTLLKHEHDFERPGHVAYFVAVSEERHQVHVGIRGTSSLEDLVTDCCGSSVPLHHQQQEEQQKRVEVRAKQAQHVVYVNEPSMHGNEGESTSEEQFEIVPSRDEMIQVEEDDGDHFIRCHEGILVSARRLIKKIRRFVKQFVVGCGYQLVLNGHSLGAGAAILSGVILRLEFPELVEDSRLHVYAIAPPPVLDHDSAIGSASFITSFVNNSDFIPRCSLYNLALVLEGLKCLHRRLDEKHLNPTGPKTTASFFHHLSEGIKGEALLSIEEWNDAIRNGAPNIRQPDHLFVAGRVYLVYVPWKEEVGDAEDRTGHYQCIETDGAASVLSQIEADGPRLFTDHVCSSYFEAMGMEYELG